MDLICPECRGTLQMVSAQGAVCAQHGGRFDVLFDRAAAPVAAVPAKESSPACAVHPRQPAVAGCAACGKHVCALCSFDVNRQTYCGDCASEAASARNAQPESGFASLDLTPATPAGWRRRDEAGKCFDHPENDSVASCRLCAKRICATCDFALPGGVHLCPVCVENSQSSDEVSPKRKKLAYIALACAIWSTILFVLMFAGAFNELFTDDAAGKGADLIITNLTLWPLLIGTGLAMSANERRLKRTGLMKLVLWWNGVLGAIFLLIVVAANLGVFG